MLFGVPIESRRGEKYDKLENDTVEIDLNSVRAARANTRLP